MTGMLGKRDPQRRLFGATTRLGPDVVERMGFYGKVAREGHTLFHDEDFAAAYCADNGRPSCPPSVIALARLLQHYAGVSDAEVVERCRFDLRWKCALDLDLAAVDSPFVKSTFQAFRARLTLHAQEGLAFEKSVKAAREAGLLPKRLRVALDSSPVRGRGAVKDTFNLLSDAIVAVLRSIAVRRGVTAREVAQTAELERHVVSASIKGSELVDWGDKQKVGEFLDGLLEDSQRAVELAEQENCGGEEAALLRKIIAQDVERGAPSGPPKIKQGVERDRTVSVHDPEMRHGRKSSGKVYNGHKTHIAVDTKSGITTAIAVTAPAESDGSQVKPLLEQTVEATELPIDQALGDAAYSSRQAIHQAEVEGVELVTRMPSSHKGRFGPGMFQVSEDGKTAVCPGGHVAERVTKNSGGHQHRWSSETCGACLLKEACTQAKAKSRTLIVKPDFHERRARERHASSEEGRQLLRERMSVEHAIGRIKHLGGGAARYFGRTKTHSQWLWAAAVANLSLVWGKAAAATI